MLYVNFKYKDLELKSVEKKHLERLNDWIKNNNKNDHTCYSLDSQIFYRRFLEYYITEDECFVEVYKNNEIIGVFKGRLEKKNKEELFIWFFAIDKNIRNKGIGSEVIDGIIRYFKENYNINSVEVGVVQTNIEGIAFWDSLGFDVNRIVNSFFEGEIEKSRNLVVMKRIVM